MAYDFRLPRGRQGFTLVELLVVIAIIGLLVSIILPNLSGARASSRDARRVSDIKNIQLALALYYNDNFHYPCALTLTGTGSGGCFPDFYPTYMATIPRDPQTNNYYFYSSQSSNIPYPGSSLNCNARTVNYYHLGATMETPTSNLVAQDDDKTVALQTANGANNICSQSTSGLFDGNAAGCSGTTGASVPGATPDPCFDVVPPS